IAHILEEPPRRVIEFRDDVPPELQAVIDKCLTKDKEKRFQNAAEVAIALLPFAPRRSRVNVEKASKTTTAAGLSSGRELVMPPSNFPPAGSASPATTSSPQVPAIPSNPALPAISEPPGSAQARAKGMTPMPVASTDGAPPHAEARKSGRAMWI